MESAIRVRDADVERELPIRQRHGHSDAPAVESFMHAVKTQCRTEIEREVEILVVDHRKPDAHLRVQHALQRPVVVHGGKHSCGEAGRPVERLEGRCNCEVSCIVLERHVAEAHDIGDPPALIACQKHERGMRVERAGEGRCRSEQVARYDQVVRYLEAEWTMLYREAVDEVHGVAEPVSPVLSPSIVENVRRRDVQTYREGP